jgi:HK97 family phage prohead protease
MMQPSEVRAFALNAQFRASAEGRHMIGLVAPYNVRADVGPFTETLRPGVFKKSIAQAARALPLHVMHRHDEVPVGKAVGWEDGSEGLVGDFLFDSRSDAQEAARLAEEGLLSALSVGFLPLESGTRWDFSGDKPHADRIEARMLEASLCSVPVYEKAGVLAMRSMGVPGQEQTNVVPTPRLLEARAWLVSLRR